MFDKRLLAVLTMAWIVAAASALAVPQDGVAGAGIETWSRTETNPDGTTTTIEGRADRAFRFDPRPDYSSWEESRTTRDKDGKVIKKVNKRIEQDPFDGEVTTETVEEHEDLGSGRTLDTETTTRVVRDGSDGYKRVRRSSIEKKDGETTSVCHDYDDWEWEITRVGGRWRRTGGSRSCSRYKDGLETSSSVSHLDTETGEWRTAETEYDEHGARKRTEGDPGDELPPVGIPDGVLPAEEPPTDEPPTDEPPEDPAGLPPIEASNPVRPPDGSTIVMASTAFGGGSLTGVVIGPDTRPISNVPVQVSSLTGVIVETQTDEDGKFESPVPAEVGDKITATLAGIATGAAGNVVMSVVSSLPDQIPHQPPHFLQPGAPVEVVGDYTEVVFEDPAHPLADGQISSGEELGSTPSTDSTSATGRSADQVGTYRSGETSSVGSSSNDGGPAELLAETGVAEVPAAVSIGPAGTPAVTKFLVPPGISPGNLVLSMTDSSGVVERFNAATFEMSGFIDQDRLTSGQKTEFTYNFRFPPGEPRDVWLTVNTTGPINYPKAGKRQRLHITADGSATFVGKVKATKSSPGGLTFGIHAVVQPQ